MNNVNCGYLDNILFDYQNGNLPLDKVLDNEMGLLDGLTWAEESKIRKYYSLAKKQGAMGVYHLKLCYTIQDIIKKYFDGAKWHNKFVSCAFKEIR